MRILRRLARLLALFLLAGAAWAGLEYTRGVGGPRPGPDPASEREGRELLRQVLEAHQAARWSEPGRVRFDAIVSGTRAGGRTYRLEFDVSSRSADFEVDGLPGRRFHYDAAAKKILELEPGAGAPPLPRRIHATLERILPSIGFWAQVPAVFDDTTAVTWRLPDAGGRPRLAVRWRGQEDWFALDIDPLDFRLRSLEFVDARLTPLLRWHGEPAGEQFIDGRPFPGEWRFSARARPLRFLTGGRVLAVISYAPGRPAPPAGAGSMR